MDWAKSKSYCSGAFVDGFENGNIPFNSYKILRNCNCIITSNQDNLNISNKQNSIIFYKDDVPVRLMVINKETDIDKCIMNWTPKVGQFINSF